MEQDPPQGSDQDKSHEPERISDLILPALEEIERLERDANAADDELRAALQRQAELQRAVARDPHFEEEYDEATRQISELWAQRRERERLANPDEPSGSV